MFKYVHITVIKIYDRSILRKGRLICQRVSGPGCIEGMEVFTMQGHAAETLHVVVGHQVGRAIRF